MLIKQKIVCNIKITFYLSEAFLGKMYDRSNPFAKILRGELPCRKVYEDEFSISFWSIEPKAPVHILVVPKGEYIDYEDFVTKASTQEIAGLAIAVEKTAKVMNLSNGYRIVINKGKDSGQTVFHLHFHLLGKSKLSDDIEEIL